jgi:hypothetical protein
MAPFSIRKPSAGRFSTMGIGSRSGQRRFSLSWKRNPDARPVVSETSIYAGKQGDSGRLFSHSGSNILLQNSGILEAKIVKSNSHL